MNYKSLKMIVVGLFFFCFVDDVNADDWTVLPGSMCEPSSGTNVEYFSDAMGYIWNTSGGDDLGVTCPLVRHEISTDLTLVRITGYNSSDMTPISLCNRSNLGASAACTTQSVSNTNSNWSVDFADDDIPTITSNYYYYIQTYLSLNEKIFRILYSEDN